MSVNEENVKTQPVITSIEWLDAMKIDKSFTDDVPLIPGKASQATYDALIENATDKLFDNEPPATFAFFVPWESNIKRLFLRRVLATLDTDSALAILDNLENEVDGEKILAMLYTLNDLNDLLEEIFNRIFATLKS